MSAADEIPPHPAKFSDPIVHALAKILKDELTHRIRELRAKLAAPDFVPPAATMRLQVLDPFAGVGGIHAVGEHLDQVDTWGVEIEPEWAAAHPRTYVGDALNLEFDEETFGVIMTSPAYGNRMADHFEAKDTSRRLTYRHQLGRALSDNNAGKLQWGDHYREFHRAAWIEAKRVLGVGGLFVVNVSDHIRAGKRVPVTAWHKETLVEIGLVFIREEKIETRRMRFGANNTARVDHESILVFRKPRISNEI